MPGVFSTSGTKLSLVLGFFTLLGEPSMNLKKPLTYSEQVLKLIEHGIIVNDARMAEVLLSRVNYYRFTGYALQFRKNPENSEYISGITFEKIYRIYQFDEAIRDICRKYIEIAEVYYRTQMRLECIIHLTTLRQDFLRTF